MIKVRDGVSTIYSPEPREFKSFGELVGARKLVKDEEEVVEGEVDGEEEVLESKLYRASYRELVKI